MAFNNTIVKVSRENLRCSEVAGGAVLSY